MTPDSGSLLARLEGLERSIRHTRVVAATTGLGLLMTWLIGATRGGVPLSADTLRTKVLVIEDSAGHDRIVLGAPMPDGRQYAGMKIVNPDGAEQFGLGLKLDGSLSMGFDTRPGVGDPRNRERLNMGVTSSGQGWIRYLDNRTRARLFVRLDSADAPSVQFLDWQDHQRILVRQLGWARDTTFEWKP